LPILLPQDIFINGAAGRESGRTTRCGYDDYGQMLERFRFPPNVFDGIEPASTIKPRRKCGLLEEDNKRLTAELAECKNAGLPKRRHQKENSERIQPLEIFHRPEILN